MASSNSVKDTILTILRDTNQTNYGDAELLEYFNLALEHISDVLERHSSLFGQQSTTLSYADTEYYTALPTGFTGFAMNQYGEPQVFDSDGNRLREADLDEIDGWVTETSADVGSPTAFYYDADYFYVHPRCDGATSITLKYYKKETLSALSDTATDMPWNSRFDDIVRQFVVRMCRLRSERVPFWGLDEKEFSDLNTKLVRVILGRRGDQMRPERGYGWG